MSIIKFNNGFKMHSNQESNGRSRSLTESGKPWNMYMGNGHVLNYLNIIGRRIQRTEKGHKEREKYCPMRYNICNVAPL